MTEHSKRLTWEEPPRPGSNARVDHTSTVRKLKARKGEWARIGEYASSSSSASAAYQIRNAELGPYSPVGAFESVSRKVDGGYWVFARYVGEEKGSERSASDAPEGA
jgi:hypothetical protein